MKEMKMNEMKKYLYVVLSKADVIKMILNDTEMKENDKVSNIRDQIEDLFFDGVLGIMGDDVYEAECEIGGEVVLEGQHIYKIPIRNRNAFLPEIGIDGSMLDGAKYAVIDMDEKIDTGLYGSVRYED